MFVVIFVYSLDETTPLALSEAIVLYECSEQNAAVRILVQGQGQKKSRSSFILLIFYILLTLIFIANKNQAPDRVGLILEKVGSLTFLSIF